jgi:hypothetical protein
MLIAPFYVCKVMEIHHQNIIQLHHYNIYFDVLKKMNKVYNDFKD